MKHQRRREPHSDPEPGPGGRPVLAVRVHRTGSDLVVQLTGELCSRTADLLRETLSGALRAVPGPRLVLDLSRARLTDRFGLGVLVALRNLALQTQGRLILVHPAADTLALLADTGLDRHLHACTSVEVAGSRIPAGLRPGRPLSLRVPVEPAPAPEGKEV